jgi:hypothetical protein
MDNRKVKFEVVHAAVHWRAFIPPAACTIELFKSFSSKNLQNLH